MSDPLPPQTTTYVLEEAETADAVDVASQRHGRASNDAFVDGHVEARAFGTIYEPDRQVDHWNPSLAP